MVPFQKGTQKFHETNFQLDEIYISPPGASGRFPGEDSAETPCHFCSIYYSILFQYYHLVFVGKTHCFHKLQRQTGKKSASKHIADLKETHQIKLLKNFQDSAFSVGISKKHPFKISTTPKLPPPPPHLVSLKGIPWQLRIPFPSFQIRQGALSVGWKTRCRGPEPGVTDM